MISLAEDVRDIAGWPAIEWGMTEAEVQEALAGRVSRIVPIARFANSYAPFKGALTIEEYPFEVFPQFSFATGESCQVLFRASDADADRLERMREILTACYGRPVGRGTKRTWRGRTAAVELDTVKAPSPRSSCGFAGTPSRRRRKNDHAPDHRDRSRHDEQSRGVR